MEGEEEIWECDSTFWSATLQPVVADQDFMPHIKAKHVPFQIMHGSFICHQRLQSGKPKCWITLSDFLFPFHNLTWGFCFCLHIIPLFCRFGGDKHPGTADISFYPNSMGKQHACSCSDKNKFKSNTSPNFATIMLIFKPILFKLVMIKRFIG